MLMAIVSLMARAPGQHRPGQRAPGGQHRAGRRATARAEPTGARHRPAQRHPGGDRPAQRRRADPGQRQPAARTRTEAPERDPIAPGHRPRQYRARHAAAARALVATGQDPLPRRLAQRRPPPPPLAERGWLLDDVSRFEIRAWVPERAGRACRHAAKSAPADWRSACRGSPATAWSAIDGWWPCNEAVAQPSSTTPPRQW